MVWLIPSVELVGMSTVTIIYTRMTFAIIIIFQYSSILNLLQLLCPGSKSPISAYGN